MMIRITGLFHTLPLLSLLCSPIAHAGDDFTDGAYPCEPPTLISTIEGLDSPQGLTVEDGYAYLVNYGKLAIIDVSDPHNPELLCNAGGLYLPAFERVEITINQGAAYIGDAIINIEDKTDPWFMRYGAPGNAPIADGYMFKKKSLTDVSRPFCGANLEFTEPLFEFASHPVGTIAGLLTDQRTDRYDISDPLSPVLVQSGSPNYSFTPDYARYTPPYMILEEEDGTTAINTYHQATDNFISIELDDFWAHSVAARGEIVFAAKEGLEIYLLTPEPKLIARYLDEPGTEGIKAIRRLGEYFITAGHNSFAIIDIKTNPISGVSTPYEHTYLAIEGDTALLSAGQIETDGLGASVIDLSDITDPRYVARIPVDEPYGIDIASGLAYVAAKRDGLAVYDLADPANPAALATYNTSTNQSGTPNTRDIEIAGQHAYAIDRNAGLTVYEFDQNDQLLPIGSLSFGEGTHRIAIQGHTAFISGLSRLFIVDIADPANPQILSDIPELPGNRAYIQTARQDGDLLYTADMDNGYRIFDIANPADPIELARFDANVSTDKGDFTGLVYDAFPDGNLLHVAMSSFGFATYDNTDPMNPVLIRHNHGGPEQENNIRYRGFIRRGNLLHVSAGRAGLHTFDLNGCVVCPIDLNGDGALNFFDVTIFIEAFVMGDSIADLNQDSMFNFFDVTAFIADYNAGCP